MTAGEWKMGTWCALSWATLEPCTLLTLPLLDREVERYGVPYIELLTDISTIVCVCFE